jgi:hypothetical protein
LAHLGSKDRYLVTVIKGSHVPVVGNPVAPVILHMTTAFFDYYLRDQQDEAQYLTEKYVDSVEAQLKLGLVWGAYTGK